MHCNFYITHRVEQSVSWMRAHPDVDLLWPSCSVSKGREGRLRIEVADNAGCFIQRQLQSCFGGNVQAAQMTSNGKRTHRQQRISIHSAVGGFQALMLGAVLAASLMWRCANVEPTQWTTNHCHLRFINYFISYILSSNFPPYAIMARHT